MLTEPQGCVRLLLLRHPELAEAYRTRAVGQGDAELSRRGREHALHVLRLLSPLAIDRIFTPPAAHCVATAQALAKDRQMLIEIEPRLADQDLGDWQGRDWSELHATEGEAVREFFQVYGTVAPPGGETLHAAIDRCLGWWAAVRAELADTSALVVGAAPVLQGFAGRLLGLPLGRTPGLSLPPAALAILDVFGDDAALRTWHPLCPDDRLP